MAGKGARGLTEAMKSLGLSSTHIRPLIPKRFSTTASRCMATEATPEESQKKASPFKPVFSRERIPLWRPDAKVPVTIHAFPSLEPRSLEYYSVQHLHVPLRKDLLHLAVVYEADMTRQGSAHAKTAWEVRGSHRKLYAQKGTGKARAGWKQSPIRRGGGKAHGPRNNRVWSTDLNRKVYDQAWRIALSYRYRRGELVIVEDNSLEIPVRPDFLQMCREGTLRPELQASFWKRYVTELMDAQGLGKAAGRSLFVAQSQRQNLWLGINSYAGEHGEAVTMDEVDVKDLLEKGRVVMERNVLKALLAKHQSDLVSHVAIHGWVNRGPPIGQLALS